MRTNIEIDDTLIHQAMNISGISTKKAVVEEALRLVVQLKKQEGLAKLFGKVQWDGDLTAIRKSDFLDDRGFHKRPEPASKPKRPGHDPRTQSGKPFAAD